MTHIYDMLLFHVDIQHGLCYFILILTDMWHIVKICCYFILIFSMELCFFILIISDMWHIFMIRYYFMLIFNMEFFNFILIFVTYDTYLWYATISYWYFVWNYYFIAMFSDMTHNLWHLVVLTFRRILIWFIMIASRGALQPSMGEIL